MLYGYREKVDNRVATLVVAADTVAEFDGFIAAAKGQQDTDSPRNYVEIYTSQKLQHLTEDLYRGYKKSIYCFYHDGADQQTAFVDEWQIREVAPMAGRDRQTDMTFAAQKDQINADKALRDAAEAAAEAKGEEYHGDGTPRTIAEIHGITEEDRWDRRSDEEKEEDRKMKERMKELQKQGKVSEDSFEGGKYGDQAAASANGTVHVTDVNTTRNADGSIDIDSIRAVKHGGPIDEEQKARNEAAFDEKIKAALGGKKAKFTPDDFANVLRGDGSADHLDVKGDMDIRRGAKPIERPSLSETAEAARKVYQEEQSRILDERAKQKRKEADVTARGERDRGIFRGSDLGGDFDMDFADLPDDVKAAIAPLFEDQKLPETVPVKEYPYNSELGGRWLLPSDTTVTGLASGGGYYSGSHVVAGVNANLVGTVSMGDPSVMVVEKEDTSKDAWAIYRKIRLGENDEQTASISLVKLR